MKINFFFGKSRNMEIIEGHVEFWHYISEFLEKLKDKLNLTLVCKEINKAVRTRDKFFAAVILLKPYIIETCIEYYGSHSKEGACADLAMFKIYGMYVKRKITDKELANLGNHYRILLREFGHQYESCVIYECFPLSTVKRSFAFGRVMGLEDWEILLMCEDYITNTQDYPEDSSFLNKVISDNQEQIDQAKW